MSVNTRSSNLTVELCLLCMLWLLFVAVRTLFADSLHAVEEIKAAIHHVKRDSSGGHDQLSPHHLAHSGPLHKNWIFNTVFFLEDIPSSFRNSIILPVYKGKGKDPLLQSRYQGTTLTSILAKTLEFVLLDRLLPPSSLIPTYPS